MIGQKRSSQAKNVFMTNEQFGPFSMFNEGNIEHTYHIYCIILPFLNIYNNVLQRAGYKIMKCGVMNFVYIWNICDISQHDDTITLPTLVVDVDGKIHDPIMRKDPELNVKYHLKSLSCLFLYEEVRLSFLLRLLRHVGFSNVLVYKISRLYKLFHHYNITLDPRGSYRDLRHRPNFIWRTIDIFAWNVYMQP